MRTMTKTKHLDVLLGHVGGFSDFQGTISGLILFRHLPWRSFFPARYFPLTPLSFLQFRTLSKVAWSC